MMTRRHFELVAQCLRASALPPEHAERVAETFAVTFAALFPRFRRDLFLAAALDREGESER
jgi:hypothetical protein